MDFLATKVKDALQLDDESVQQIVTNAEQMNGADLRSFLMGFLGDEYVVNEYLKKRNQERQPSKPKTLQEPEKPRAPQPATNFVSNGVWDPQESKRSKKAAAGRNGEKKGRNANQVKIESLSDIDSALKALEISENKRSRCNCMAQRHPLLEIAPNCLNCGKIICVKEGLGKCTSCGKDLIDRDQLDVINAILQSEKDQISSTMGKKTKQRLDFDQGTSLSQNLQAAETQLNRLLEFQDTGAQRTKIIDQVSDFETPGYGTNQWASPIEQAKQLKRQQKQLRKLEQARLSRQGRGRKVISIDVKGNKVYTKEEDAPVSDSQSEGEDDEPEPEEQQSKSKPVVWNPNDYGKGFINPVHKGGGAQTSSAALVNSGVVDFNDDTRLLEL